ncbi:MAG: alpha/beta hydrolase [Bermanella sp.]
MAISNLKQWKDLGQLTQVTGDNIFYISKGSGPALLLIHGFPTSSWDWHTLLTHLSEHFQVIAIDMLGYGFSDKPLQGDYSTKAQANRIKNVLKQLGVNACHIMTYSYGSSVAQEILHQDELFEVQVKSLCLMNGGLFPNSNRPKLAQTLLLGRLGFLVNLFFSKRVLDQNLRSIFGPDTQPTPLLITQYWELININDGKRILPTLIQYLKERQVFSQKWQQALIDFKKPIQLIIGDHDSISGIDLAIEFQEKISKNNIHILKNIGHYPQLESPKLVLKLFNEFQNINNK